VRERRIVLDPREPLLLDGRDEGTVDVEGRRGVAVVRVDTEDVQGSRTSIRPKSTGMRR
jgi:hypothetical protein